MRRAVRHWAEVREVRRASVETWWLELAASPIAEAAAPGQFVMVGLGIGQVGAPFLPRPFSIGLAGPDRTVGLLLREFGAGTRRLARASRQTVRARGWHEAHEQRQRSPCSGVRRNQCRRY